MNYSEQTYTELLRDIKSKQPELRNPRLTSVIVSKIKQPGEKSKPARFLKIVSLSSSVAAMFLLGLFFSEQQHPVVEVTSRPPLTIPLHSLLRSEKKHTTLQEVSSLLKARKEEKQRRKEPYSSTIHKITNP